MSLISAGSISLDSTFKLSLFFTQRYRNIIITLSATICRLICLTVTLFFEVSTKITVEENYRKIICSQKATWMGMGYTLYIKNI